MANATEQIERCLQHQPFDRNPFDRIVNRRLLAFTGDFRMNASEWNSAGIPVLMLCEDEYVEKS